MDENRNSFWMTLPGILTGVAAVITAAGAIYLGVRNTPQPTQPTVTQSATQPSAQPQPTSTQGTSQPPAQTPAKPQEPNSQSQPTGTPPSQKFTGQMGPLERGISYSGGDMYDRPSQSPEECSKLCFNDDRCRAATFIISQQRCWLKNQVNAPQQSSDMVSARKQD
jgi:hypothetical protein